MSRKKLLRSLRDNYIHLFSSNRTEVCGGRCPSIWFRWQMLAETTDWNSKLRTCFYSYSSPVSRPPKIAPGKLPRILVLLEFRINSQYKSLISTESLYPVIKLHRYGIHWFTGKRTGTKKLANQKTCRCLFREFDWTNATPPCNLGFPRDLSCKSLC